MSVADADRHAPPYEALGHLRWKSNDELAHETGVDPVALRLVNDAAVDPLSGRPFSTRAMRQCHGGAARSAGCARHITPMRDGVG